MTSDRKLCVIVGVGPGNGAALARRYAAEGYATALIARRADYIGRLAAEIGPSARAYPCDVSDPELIRSTFTRIGNELGDADVVAYNAGSGTWGTFDEIDAAALEASWRVNVLGLFEVAKATTPGMRAKGGGAIIITGATASLRGGAKTTAFAASKAAQRSLAQSLARHLWPESIHVALVIIDGVVDLPATRKQMPDKPEHAFVNPEDFAAVVLGLTNQPRSAWSFEVEARPFVEPW